MIIDRLIVERYGHFERLELDLGSGRGGLTVIWGANEAGKSTLLQAVRDLFFGIDHQTPLAFRFDYKSMRVRASLRDSAGQRLAVERRKKRKASLTGTLSSQAGVVDIDDARFAAYFGGIRGDLYNALFGFDLVDLQRGAGVLEDAGLSEVLGGGALGGSGDRIRQVLADLHREGRDLYKNQGKVPAINRGLAQVREVQTALREATLQQGAYQDLTARLARIRDEIAANGAELSALRASRARIQALQTALPEARELEALRRELAAAAPGGDGLDEEGARRALRLVAEAAIAGTRSAALAAEIGQQEARIAGIAVDEALLAEEAAIERVTRRAGHLAALRREVTGERAALAVDAKKLAEETSDMEGVEAPTGAALERLRELVERWTRAAAEVAEATRADQQQRADIEAARAILGRDQDDADDREALHLAIELEELGERRAHLDRLAADALRLETEISAGLAPFGVGLDAAAAAELVLPEATALADALARRADLDERGRRLDAERGRLARETGEFDQVEEDLAKRTGSKGRQARAGSGAEAAKAALARVDDARGRRQRAWDELRMAWLTGPERLTELERYGLLRALEAAIADADEAVDALGDHADHLAEVKALARQRAARVEAERALAGGEAALAADVAAWERAWEALWRSVPLPRAPEPRDALACRRGLEGAREAALRLANVRQREASLAPGLVAFEARLRRHLRQEHAGWSLLVKLLREREREAQARRGRRESIRERLASIEAARELTLGLLESSRGREAALRDEVRSRLGELGLRRDLDPPEGLRRLDRLADARARAALLGPREAALREREASLAEAEREAQALLRRLELDADARTLDDHLEELARRLASARGAALARTHAREALAQRAPLLEQARAHGAELERQLAELRARARVGDDEALKAAAERALRRDRDLARLAELGRRQDERLGPPGEAREALEAALRSADPAALREELAHIDPRLAHLERQRTSLAEQKGKLDQEIESLGGDRAARLGAEAQSLLAELSERVDRYLLVHLAEKILNRVTDRFASENQPAILGQTSALLARITGGRHVRVSADRQAGTLVVHDAAGVARLPRELSTGTREQLFLALRLAYILEYCDRAEPLPVIIDDVLVNFDRARARSTLLALCEVARSAQVLLFTCHHHIVDLARAVAPEVPILALPTIDPEIRAVDATTLRVDPEGAGPTSDHPST